MSLFWQATYEYLSRLAIALLMFLCSAGEDISTNLGAQILASLDRYVTALVHPVH